MGAGTKILAGCGCAAIGAAVVVVAGVGLGAYWLEGRVGDVAGSLESLTSITSQIDEWERQANAHPYVRRPDGVVAEPRLLVFLDVRRQVHSVYQTCAVDLEALAESTTNRDVTTSAAELVRLGGRAARMFGALRLAQVRALAEAGMSEEEYYAIQAAVYVAAGAWETSERTGTMPAEAVADAARRMQEAMRAGIDKARAEGVPGSERLSEAEVKRLEEAVARMGASSAEALSVPPGNVALFRKHQDAIHKYAMHGLALLGL